MAGENRRFIDSGLVICYQVAANLGDMGTATSSVGSTDLSAASPAHADRQPLANTAQAERRNRERFVAFSFCWADLLLEVDAAAKVVFAAGATDIAINPLIAMAAAMRFSVRFFI